MNIDTTIHNTSNHPMGQKTTAFRYYIKRLISLPLTQLDKSKQWNNIINMAKNNTFSAEQITKIKNQISQKSKEHTYTNKTKTWTTFTNYGGLYEGHYKYIQEEHNKNSIQDHQQHIQLTSIRKTYKWEVKWHIQTYMQYM